MPLLRAPAQESIYRHSALTNNDHHRLLAKNE